MTERSEALAQLSRLLGDERLRSVSPEEAERAIRSRLNLMVDGLVAEAARSDDVFDRDSALLYLDQRILAFSGLISDDLQQELRLGTREQIERW